MVATLLTARKFCETDNMECPGENIEPAKFAPTARQCTINCAQNLKCMSAFYSASKACNLRSDRCSVNELRSAEDGLDLYRLSEFSFPYWSAGDKNTNSISVLER